MKTSIDGTARLRGNWLDRTVYDLARQLRVSYVPPLMVYLAADC